MAKVRAVTTCLLLAAAVVVVQSVCTDGDCDSEADAEALLQTKLVQEAFDISSEESSKGAACDFESAPKANLYCDMWNPKASGDQFDWSRASRTPSSSTGPSTPGNNFLYIETSHPRKRGDKAILESKPVTLGSASSLSFKYHMKGRNIGELKVVMKLPTTEVTLWSKKGQQGSNWQAADVKFPSQVAGQLAYIRFVGVRGNSWAGDIAIDEVSLDLGGSTPATTIAPTSPPTTIAPTSPPTQAPTTAAPTSPPTSPPTNPPTNPPSTMGPTNPPTNPPTAAPTSAPGQPGDPVHDELKKLAKQVKDGLSKIEQNAKDLDTALNGKLSKLESAAQQILNSLSVSGR